MRPARHVDLREQKMTEVKFREVGRGQPMSAL